MGLAQALQSFLAEPAKIADVSLIEGTIAGCNYVFFFASPRNRTQEPTVGTILSFSRSRELAVHLSQGQPDLARFAAGGMAKHPGLQVIDPRAVGIAAGVRWGHGQDV